jgi:hypothetical protein
MEPVILTILGAGSVRCCPAIIGALGSYYGERPLELRLYDADAERLDLFDRLARVVFEDTNVEHRVLAFEDPEEALTEATLVVLALDENCARKFLKLSPGESAPTARAEAAERLCGFVPRDALVLSLLPPEITIGHDMYYRIDWPPALDEQERLAMPFQVLRWLHREEAIYDLIDAHERSPLKRWLDDPNTAEPVLGSGS